MGRELTLNIMSMAAGERETERLVKNGKLAVKIIKHQPVTD